MNTPFNPVRSLAAAAAAAAALTLPLSLSSCSTVLANSHGAAAPTILGSTAPGATLPPTDAAAAAQEPVTSAAALSQLDNIPVKGRAPMTGYARGQFGPAWEDIDQNSCDTRNDILRRDLTDLRVKAGATGCVILSGTLNDPYTGTVIHFERGPHSADVQIDHVVALADAWQKGARQWDAGKRLQFANDPANLLAVDGPANMQKGAGDLATWLPSNKSFRCTYAAKTVDVKAKYGLWMTQAEHDKARDILIGCS